MLFFYDYSSKITEAVGLLFGTNVARVRTIENSYKSANMSVGLIAMETENSHRLI